MREIKFRVFNRRGEMEYIDDLYWFEENSIHDASECELMQYTGLLDKNGNGYTEVYEGDIITIEGTLGGNIYENEPRETDIVIPRIGTKDWHATYKKAVGRGFNYAE